MMAAHTVEGAGLPKRRDPKVDGRGAGRRREERKGVGVPVEGGDERGSAAGREELFEERAPVVPLPDPRLGRAEEEVCARPGPYAGGEFGHERHH